MSDKLFSAQFDENIPTIDLHGMSVFDAEHELDGFLHQAHNNNSPTIKIIHGKGHGKLHEFVKEFLSNHKLVTRFENAQAPNELGGVTYALLKT